MKSLVICTADQNIVREIKRMRWAVRVARVGGRIDVYWISVGNPERMRPLGISRLRCEDNIKMDLQEVECGCYVLDGVG
jgi:hypothetical protein